MDDGDEASFSSLEEFEFDVRLKNMLQEKWGINSLFPHKRKHFRTPSRVEI